MTDRFKEWFLETMRDADGNYNHLPDWLEEDMRRAWDAALSVPAPGTDKWLGELLAVIHRDGGQYQATHGIETAVEDAHSILAAAFSTPQAGDMGAVKVSEAELIKRLCESVEGECDGLAIDEDQARAILDHLGALSSTPVGEMDAAGIPFALIEKVENRVAYRIALGSTPRAIAEDILQIVAGVR